MKPVIGKKLKGRAVVSTAGLRLGEVLDVYFERGGELLSLVVKPEKITKDIEEYINPNNLIEVPFEKVQAIGRYVIVDFPF
ncbi:hypothetical protein DRN74_03755 [Candidatus Micrarchaeota archaeon]|nr:MAG: hypothetical protein DRN74_03755 [Candidatus Micrarchaeota archaeon]